MPFIELEKVWTDDDEMVQIELRASNDSQHCEQDFFAYPDDLAEFANELRTFPKNTEHSVTFEYGSDPKYYCHLALSAKVLDQVGHSALEVNADNRLAPPLEAQAHFYLPCEAATVNRLGEQLASWAEAMDGPFRFEWNNA